MRNEVMKKWIHILFLVSLIVLISCARFRKGLVELSEEDLKNAETTRQVSKNLLSTWLLNSGFLRGALGNRIDELPRSAVEAMDELDEIAKRYEAGDPFDDYALGYSLGLRIRMLTEVVLKALMQYAPSIFEALPYSFATIL